MKAAAFMLATCAAMALPIGSVAAGQCTAEVEKLKTVLTAQDAGSGSGPSASMWMAPSPFVPSPAAEGGAAPTAQPIETDASTAMIRETTGSSVPNNGPVARQDRPADLQSRIAETHSMAGAMNAIERARLLDAQGKENECLSAVGMAKLISGFR